MNCASVKAWVRERFDQGLPLEDGFETHFESCERCRVYVEQLRAIEIELADLTVEAPSPAFESALLASVRRDRNATSRAWIAGFTALSILILIVLGWRVPVGPYFDASLAQLAVWQPDIAKSMGLFAPFLDWGREAWASIELPALLTTVQRPWISGASIAGLAVVLVGFNALLRRWFAEPGSGSIRRAR